jgi:phage FluMu protein Com
MRIQCPHCGKKISKVKIDFVYSKIIPIPDDPLDLDVDSDFSEKDEDMISDPSILEIQCPECHEELDPEVIKDQECPYRLSIHERW